MLGRYTRCIPSSEVRAATRVQATPNMGGNVAGRSSTQVHVQAPSRLSDLATEGAPTTTATPPLERMKVTPQQAAWGEEPSASHGISILRFLKNRCLLITGATGFLAKVLVEKVLWEQPEVGRMYLLIQPRGDQTGDERLGEMIRSSPLFGRLRERHGAAYETFMRSKLAAVEGNLTRPGMGVDASRLADLSQEVEVLINSAASTSFDERYDSAVRLNTLGALECAKFAASCKKLESFVHVSTAFVNGFRQGYTAERPFDFGRTVGAEMRNLDATSSAGLLDVDAEIKEALAAPKEAEERLRAAGFSGSDLEQAVERELVSLGMQRAAQHGWQDTYVFTKAMGEMLLRREVEGRGVPCCIVRPSIVESTLREPMPGWIEGLRMSDPIIIAYGKSQMVGFAGDRNGVLDVVPCDIVINACLAAMAKNARSNSSSQASTSGLPVYHVATSTANPLGISAFVSAVNKYFKENPMLDRSGAPVKVEDMIVYGGYYQMVFDTWRRYALPWQLRELQEKLMPWDASKRLSSEEKKAKLIQQKVYEQLTYLANIYVPYTFYAARFGSENVQALQGEIVPEERQAFYFGLGDFTWEDYLTRVHIPGLRKFVLKGRA